MRIGSHTVPQLRRSVFFAGVWACAISMASIGLGQVAPAPRPMAPLKSVKVPLPSNLDEFVKDRAAAIALGKALFWDMQVGSDGWTACASCHWHAGADARFVNTLSTPDSYKEFGKIEDPLKKVTAKDFPFLKLANVDPKDTKDPYTNPNSRVVSRRAETLGSQGVQRRIFTSVEKWRAKDYGYVTWEPTFTVHGTNLRTVTHRNSPTVINAVFNHRLNWDGKASFYFNGVNSYGKYDPDARVYASSKTYTTTTSWVKSWVGIFFTWKQVTVTKTNEKLDKVSIQMDNAALASQAVGPPLATEMSWIGREFPEVGRKMLNIMPLAKQQVYFTDSVLAPYSVYYGKGLWVDYGTLIRRAFQDKWWDSSLTTADGYTQMEANFSLYFGVALMMYQSTLVSDDSPMDRFLAGDENAISALAKTGKFVFEGNGSPAGGCNICHSGPETTAAAIGEIVQADGNQKQVSIMTRRDPSVSPTFQTPFDKLTLYDRGFYNLGIAPTWEDKANGGGDDFGPFSPSKRAAAGQDIGQAGQEVGIAKAGAMPIAVNGTFKTPTLRNVELTGPYNHNGGRLHLEDVMKFYARGSDFNLQNGADLDQGVSGIPPLQDPTRGGVPVLVEFLKSLTDDRVRYQSEQFDHPELFVPNGFIKASGSELIESNLRVPPVGRYGIWSKYWGTIDGTEFRPAHELISK